MTLPSDAEIEAAWTRVRMAGRDREPRRQLAALLNARGDPFGEFLTLCLTKTQGESDDEYRARAARGEELLAQHGDAWFPYAPDDKAHSRRRWTDYMVTGLPETRAVFSWSPPAREVLTWFTARYPLRQVSFVGVDPADGVRCLEERGLFPGLDQLSLNECPLSDDALEAIACASTGVRSLELFKLAALDGARLFGCRAFRETKAVGIGSTSLDAATLRALWRLPALDSLRLYKVGLPKTPLQLSPVRLASFSLEATVGDAWVGKMLRSLDTRALQKLSLRVGGSLAKLFPLLRDRARAGELNALAELELESNHVNDEEIAVLLEAPPPNLVRLDLTDNSIGANGMTALAAWARSSTSLRRLRLTGNFLGSGVFKDGTDWDGTVLGSYEEGLSTEGIRSRFGFPAALLLH